MIVVVGTPTEDPVALLLAEAAQAGIEAVVLDESRAGEWNLQVDGGGQGLVARAVVAGREIDLESATGVYLRLTSPRVSGAVPDPLQQARHAAALGLVTAWADATAVRVANRPRAMASNGSKPYQAALIRSLGLAVPPTLVTNDPDAARRFRAEHGRVVYKSISGVRSIVHELTDQRSGALDRVRHLPTQFQRLLEGTNVRAHVVGDEVFACRIDADTIDYRYREGTDGATMTPTALPAAMAERCVAVARALNLPLAGIDLFHDLDDQWWCFEVNPSPAYSCFEEPTGLPIAAALARWLAAGAE